jgi:hypothetical protein
MLDLDVAPRWMIDRVAEADPLDPGVFRELIDSASRASIDAPRHDTPEASPATTAGVDRIGDALRRLEHRLSGVSVVTDRSWSAPSEVTPSTGLDRREFPRRGAHGPVTIARGLTIRDATSDCWDTVLSRWLDDHGLSGELLDLSRNGLACLTIHPLMRDETIGVRLCHPEHRAPLDTTAVVIRATPLGDGRWKVVARFTQSLSFDDAYELCDHSAVTLGA